ncbi:MAG: hypothetical protein EU532_01945 [Promethearchaeota archaeon]|nr:MAG: hypothetical protein EU532_01945 [Candidatus Lokiarchaeota archaeon]
MELNLADFLTGLFSLIFIVISIFLGLKITRKYSEYKMIEYLLVGITWIGIVFPWFPSAITFLLVISTDILLSPETRFILGFGFLPTFLVIWLGAFTEIIYKEIQKKILIISTIICTVLQVTFIALVFIDISLIGTQVGLFHGTFTLFTRIYLLTILLTFFITGIIFSYKSMKLNEPEFKLRGKFLLFAFIFYTMGVILETLLPLTALTAVFIRLIMILSAFAFYFGFILPENLKKKIIKETSVNEISS